jgi:nucleotide-binding universal stress UspA family protein
MKVGRRASIMVTGLPVPETSMFKTILVPTDGSPLSQKAIAAAVEFAKVHDGRIIAIRVAQPDPAALLSEGTSQHSSRDFVQRMLDLAQQDVHRIAEAAREANVPCETVVTQSFSPYEEIVAAAERYACDVIFMASHGRKGLNRLFVGGQTQKVLAHSTIPVLVFR